MAATKRETLKRLGSSDDFYERPLRMYTRIKSSKLTKSNSLTKSKLKTNMEFVTARFRFEETSTRKYEKSKNLISITLHNEFKYFSELFLCFTISLSAIDDNGYL